MPLLLTPLDAENSISLSDGVLITPFELEWFRVTND